MISFKNKQLLFSVLMLSMLFLSACSSLPQPPGSGGKGGKTGLGGFLGGDQGLIIRVVQGAPPEVVLDKSRMPFAFVLTLENAGEAKVGTGTDNPLIVARLVGFRPSDFGLTPETAAKKIAGPLENAKKNIDDTITPGEITDSSWDNLAYVPRVDGPSVGLAMRAEVCYDYESRATAKFCMKKDVLESAEDLTICSLKGPRAYGNSGAPIHVTAVEQAAMGPGKIQLKFNIEHFGRGMYFFRNEPGDLYDACDFSDLNPNLYKMEVYVEPVQKDTYLFECSRFEERLAGGGVKGVVKSQANAPITVTCFITRTKPMEQRVYEDLFEVRLKYRYGEFVEVPILVQGYP